MVCFFIRGSKAINSFRKTTNYFSKQSYIKNNSRALLFYCVFFGGVNKFLMFIWKVMIT